MFYGKNPLHLGEIRTYLDQLERIVLPSKSFSLKLLLIKIEEYIKIQVEYTEF